MSFPSGVHLHRNTPLYPDSAVYHVSMMLTANSTQALLNLSLPSVHFYKYKHRRPRKNTRSSMHVCSCFWRLGPLLCDMENEHSTNFWWWSSVLESLPKIISLIKNEIKIFVSDFFFPLCPPHLNSTHHRGLAEEVKEITENCNSSSLQAILFSCWWPCFNFTGLAWLQEKNDTWTPTASWTRAPKKQTNTSSQNHHELAHRLLRYTAVDGLV